MNPSRIVSAAAALAVGFGITLVGTTIADSDDETLVTVEESPAADESIDADTADDADESGDDDAEQDVIEVPEPEEATTEEDIGDDDEFADEAEAEAEPTDDGDTADEPVATVSVEDAPSPVDTEPDTGRTPGSDELPDESRDPSELPSGGSPDFEIGDCINVVKLFDGTVLQEEVDYVLVDGERELLPGAPAVSGLELSSAQLFAIEITDDGVFLCDDGPEVDDFEIVEYSDAVACFEEAATYFFEEFEGLDVDESGGLFSEEEIFEYVVASRLDTRFPGESQLEGFLRAVDNGFADFRYPCSPTVVDIVFNAGISGGLDSDEFFCAAANLSTTDELLTAINGVFTLLGCQYDEV